MKHQEFIQTRHEFSNEELLDLGEQMANRLQEKADIQAERKIAVRQFRDQIKVIDQEVERLGLCIAEKFELRETRCRVEINEATGQKYYYHAETGEHLLTQDMTEDDWKLFDEEDDCDD